MEERKNHDSTWLNLNTVTFELHCSVPWMKIWGVAPSRRSGNAPAVSRCLFRECCRIGYPKDGSICANAWLINMKSNTFLSETGTLQNIFFGTRSSSTLESTRDAAEWMSKQQTHARKTSSIGKLAATQKTTTYRKLLVAVSSLFSEKNCP